VRTLPCRSFTDKTMLACFDLADRGY